MNRQRRLGASLLAVLVLAACVPSTEPTPEPRSAAALGPCTPVPAPVSVDALNEVAEKVRGPGSFRGADVGADVLLQDGRRAWLFGDTLRSADFDGQRFVRNSMLVFGEQCAHVVLPADGGALVPDRDDEVGYWPMSVGSEQRDGYDLVGVGLQRVRGAQAPDGPQAFENLGPAFARFRVERGGVPELLRVTDIGPDDVDTERPTWGAAVAVVDGWAYLYGTARPTDAAENLVFGFSMRVARSRTEHLADPSRWQYWDGEGWQDEAGRAATLIDADGGVSQTLSVFERDGRWFAVSKRDEFLGSDLVVRSAPSPTGPFVAGDPVAEIPSDPDSGELRYMPLAHPDLLQEDGSVVVSYSRNETDVEKVSDDPFLYRPRFLRIPLPD